MLRTIKGNYCGEYNERRIPKEEKWIVVWGDREYEIIQDGISMSKMQAQLYLGEFKEEMIRE
jgi:hypothetical protein